MNQEQIFDNIKYHTNVDCYYVEFEKVYKFPYTGVSAISAMKRLEYVKMFEDNLSAEDEEPVFGILEAKEQFDSRCDPDYDDVEVSNEYQEMFVPVFKRFPDDKIADIAHIDEMCIDFQGEVIDYSLFTFLLACFDQVQYKDDNDLSTAYLEGCLFHKRSDIVNKKKRKRERNDEEGEWVKRVKY